MTFFHERKNAKFHQISFARQKVIALRKRLINAKLSLIKQV
jgi:hypothetical protein